MGEYVCPKTLQGLGIINTRVMNEALLTKLIRILYNSDTGDVCSTTLKRNTLALHLLH